MRMRPITGSPHTTAGVTASNSASTLAAAKLDGLRVQASSNSNCRIANKSQLTPTAPTPPAAAEPAAPTRASKGSSQSSCKRTKNPLPPTHRRRSTQSPTMSRQKPPAPAPAVASTGCSGLMSCLSRHRRGPPQPATPRGSSAPARRSDAEAAERCLKRVQLLEEEIRRLSLWLGQEEARAAPPAAGCIVRGSAKTREQGAVAATERVRDGAKAREESTREATATAMVPATTRCVRVGQAAVVCGEEIVRLEDGSYLREVRRAGRPWGRLAVQVSRPVVPQDAASASEVLDKMAAMRADDLCKFLVEMMPLKDITGEQDPGEPVRRRAARLSSGDDLLEALVLRAMDKLESLVLEGLKIQMASPATEPADRRRDNEAAAGKDCIVHVVLMQVRDPNERYGAIGDTMVGLIEASLQRKDAAVKLEMQGLHVAGISFVNRKPSDDGRCVMWSASLRQCKGSHDGGGGGGAGDDGCRCACVRNPDRVFQR